MKHDAARENPTLAISPDSGETVTRKLLSPEQVSDLTGIPVATLAQWRYRKCGMDFLRLGRLVRYDAADVEAYLQTCRVRVRGQLTGKDGEHVGLS
jgi:predicted DNA-binding transcriptional regulator AlpA